MAFVNGARIALHPSWLVTALNKVNRIHLLQDAGTWVSYHHCSLDNLDYSKRGEERIRNLAAYLYLDQFAADELRDAISCNDLQRPVTLILFSLWIIHLGLNLHTRAVNRFPPSTYRLFHR